TPDPRVVNFDPQVVRMNLNGQIVTMLRTPDIDARLGIGEGAPAAAPQSSVDPAIVQAVRAAVAPLQKQTSNEALLAQGASRPGGVLVRGTGAPEGGAPNFERIRGLEGQAFDDALGGLTPEQLSAFTLQQIQPSLSSFERSAPAAAPTIPAASLMTQAATASPPIAAGGIPAPQAPVTSSAPIPASSTTSPEAVRVDAAGALRPRAPTGGSGALMDLRRAREQAAVPTATLVERALRGGS
ncbi:MAG: hypothetical protein AAGD14_12650, partial [Planctomycetota bacterium]